MQKKFLCLILGGIIATTTAIADISSLAQPVKATASGISTNTTASGTAKASIANTEPVAVNIPCDPDSACAVVSTTSKQVINAINTDAKFQQIQGIVTPQFDFSLMTKYALGNNWKLASPDQQTQLVSLFKQLLLYTYVTALSKFKGAQITITHADGNEKKAAVISEILLPTTGTSTVQPVKVEYDLAKISTNTTWKAYDVKIENASLVTTYRNQFNDVIQSNKIDGLIKQLQTKVTGLKKTQGV